MAFGINKKELLVWQHKVTSGEIAFLTHYWLDERFPGCYTVTKVGCNNLEILQAWGKQYDLEATWIHIHNTFPHFDLFGDKQKYILTKEKQFDQIKRFNL